MTSHHPPQADDTPCFILHEIDAIAALDLELMLNSLFASHCRIMIAAQPHDVDALRTQCPDGFALLDSAAFFQRPAPTSPIIWLSNVPAAAGHPGPELVRPVRIGALRRLLETLGALGHGTAP